MIELSDSAKEYFSHLLQQQGIAGVGVRLTALHPGTPKGDCQLSFCEPEEVRADDWTIDCGDFPLIVDSASVPFLEQTSISYEAERGGGQLTIRAPRLKGKVPGAEASLVERVRYVLDAEVNPNLAAHGGRVSLVEVSASGEVVLQFGGGCHGCGQVDATLKHGIESTLKARVPEVTAIRDSTDHSNGAAPYYKR